MRVSFGIIVGGNTGAPLNGTPVSVEKIVEMWQEERAALASGGKQAKSAALIAAAPPRQTPIESIDGTPCMDTDYLDSRSDVIVNGRRVFESGPHRKFQFTGLNPPEVKTLKR